LSYFSASETYTAQSFEISNIILFQRNPKCKTHWCELSLRELASAGSVLDKED
jgi:hypothetical protein